MASDDVLRVLLADDLDAQLTRDAGRTYEIERTLRTKSMPPVARMALQREAASLRVTVCYRCAGGGGCRDCGVSS